MSLSKPQTSMASDEDCCTRNGGLAEFADAENNANGDLAWDDLKQNEFSNVGSKEKQGIAKAPKKIVCSLQCVLCIEPGHTAAYCFKYQTELQRLKRIIELDYCHKCGGKHVDVTCNPRIACSVCGKNHYSHVHAREECVNWTISTD
ncbi:unnamed protein product [Caenorhabditis bovis]|uniref:Uncharacterized protein n=1 Tax=Caenorhabditis bovis TaxID=2654633 RepID=A0A8S1F8I0_9PELO|nr:unnamed protein product [Caenorhabditis bovis]